MVIRRRTIEKIGYFNEDYKFYSQEDADYGLRIELAGLLNVYVPNLTCEHFHDADVDLSANESELTPYVRLKKEWYYKNGLKLQQNFQKYISGERSIFIGRVQR